MSVRPRWWKSTLWCCSSLPAAPGWTGDARYPPVIWHGRGRTEGRQQEEEERIKRKTKKVRKRTQGRRRKRIWRENIQPTPKPRLDYFLFLPTIYIYYCSVCKLSIEKCMCATVFQYVKNRNKQRLYYYIFYLIKDCLCLDCSLILIFLTPALLRLLPSLTKWTEGKPQSELVLVYSLCSVLQ